MPVYGSCVQARGKHLFDVIPVLHRRACGATEMPGPLELWYIRVPALSAYAYQKASSSVLAMTSTEGGVAVARAQPVIPSTSAVANGISKFCTARLSDR